MIKQIIIEPHITEKSMALVEKNKYTFIVNKNSNKFEIANMVKKGYKVDPICVSIINKIGKNILFRSRYKGKRKDFKKAIVTLPKSQKIKEFIIKE